MKLECRVKAPAVGVSTGLDLTTCPNTPIKEKTNSNSRKRRFKEI
jgi:hypothetical protein